MNYNMKVKYGDLQTFKSKKEMDHHVREFNKHLSKPQYMVLNFLKQHSLKVFGVSHLKLKTIATGTDYSLSTVRRALKALNERGFITTVHQMREKSGGIGANVYVINRMEHQAEVERIQNEQSKKNKRNAVKKAVENQQHQALAYIFNKKQTMFFNKLFKFFNSTRKSQKQKRIENILHSEYNADVPEWFYKKFKPFFSIKELIALYRTSNNRLNNYYSMKNDLELRKEVTIIAVQSLIKKLKQYHQGKSEAIKNMFAYLNVTIDVLCAKNDIDGDLYAFI